MGCRIFYQGVKQMVNLKFRYKVSGIGTQPTEERLPPDGQQVCPSPSIVL
jgi:hypothetical protein